ncbi:MAG: histone deacetylase family protein [Parachlamydiaceae bacterium]
MNKNKKTRLGILIDDVFANHKTGAHHPENCQRIFAIKNLQKNSKVFEMAEKIPPKLAKIEQLFLCHSPEYIQMIQEDCHFSAQVGPDDGSFTLRTGDVQICSRSFETALLAVGGVLQAVDHILHDRLDVAFCAIRPPGHHASHARGMGFCLLNNVAIAAKYAINHYGLDRVLIVDWDVHHGNGTQDIFENDPSVFYFSTHQWPLFPGTGRREERGCGNLLNFPIASGPGSRDEVLNSFRYDLVRAMENFKPEMIFISAGFDAHYKDPLGGMNLTVQDFGSLTEIVKSIAAKYANGKIVSVLEGGYDPSSLALSVEEHVRVLKKDA